MPRKQRSRSYRYNPPKPQHAVTEPEHQWQPCAACGYKRAGRTRHDIKLIPGYKLCSVCHDLTKRKLVARINERHKRLLKR